MRKYLKGLLAAAAIVSVLAGCSGLTESLTESVNIDTIGEGSGSGKVVSLDKQSFKADEFDRIHVSAQAMAIYVTKGSSDVLEAELLVNDSIENRFTMETDVKSRVLSVAVNEKGELFDQSLDGQKGERKLLITLPDNMYEELVITNEFGMVEASDFTVEQVVVQVNAGMITLDGVNAEIDAEVEAGQILIEGISLQNDLKTKVEAGEITIHLNEQPEAAQISLTSEVGNVRAGLEHIEFSKETISKKIGEIGTNGYRIDASVEVGSITVDVQK